MYLDFNLFLKQVSSCSYYCVQSCCPTRASALYRATRADSVQLFHLDWTLILSLSSSWPPAPTTTRFGSGGPRRSSPPGQSPGPVTISRCTSKSAISPSQPTLPEWHIRHRDDVQEFPAVVGMRPIPPPPIILVIKPITLTIYFGMHGGLKVIVQRPPTG